jgi:branched-chain amino acid transport system permease protein
MEWVLGVMQEFLQHVVNGLSLGSIYGLVALGYTLVYGVLRLINFAHGEIFMMGAFGGYFFVLYLLPAQVHPGLALLMVLAFAMACSASLGLLIERVAYRPMRDLPKLNLLITAIGVSLLLQNVAQLAFGSDPKFFSEIIPRQVLWQLNGISISNYQFIVISLSLLLMVILQALIYRTKVGTAIRAVAYSHQTAYLMGINTDRIIALTFVIGSSLAAAAGILVGLSYPRIDPMMGLFFGLKSFVAAVIGGIGSIPGAILGALIMGLSEEMVSAYFFSTFRDAIAFLFLILILIFKPVGLFGREPIEKV